MPTARLLLPFLAPLLLAAAPALTLPMEAPFVDATIDGRPVRLRVSFDAPGPLSLTPAAAARLGLAKTLPATVLVGPVRLSGSATSVTLAIGGGAARLQAMWMDRAPGTDGAAVDGIVSPAALPVAGVRLVQAGVPTGGRRVLPASYSAVGGLSIRVPVGDATILVRLAPERTDSIATAAAGAVLAAARAGTLDTEVERRTISYGIARPVRLLSFTRPLRVGTLRIRQLLVRTGDYGGDTRLPSSRVAESPDEIVVTGATERGMPVYRLSLGADQLGRCAEIGWLARPPRLRLDCPDVDGGETIR